MGLYSETLADVSESIVSSTTYDSFGNAATSIPTSYQYTGREYDADTGLYYYRNRWYDPEIGLFISEDPIGFAGGDVNLYRYVGNNPQNFIDPYGDISLGSLLSRLFSAGTSTMMLASYVNAPGPGDPVYSPGGNPSLADTIGDVLGLVATPVVGKVIGKACTFALKGIGSGAGAVGRAVGKASKSAKRSKAPAPKGVRYGPTNPGPLDAPITSTFRGGSYTATTLSETTTLYRVYGGNAGKIGSYWTRTKPSGPFQSQLDSALAPQWGNTAQKVATMKVPRGTTIYEGAAAPQSTGVGQILGGGSQVYIPRIDPRWIQ